MGQGYVFRCRNCQKEYMVFPGTGMFYHDMYEDEIRKIVAGDYGEKLKNLYESTPHAAINAANVVYVCSSCGKWEESKDLTLYAPIDPDRSYAIRKIKSRGSLPSDWDLRWLYHVIKRYYKKCPCCGKRMHKASEEEERNLSCPECGTVNEADSIMMWD